MKLLSNKTFLILLVLLSGYGYIAKLYTLMMN